MPPFFHTGVTAFPCNNSDHFTYHSLRPRSTDEEPHPIIILLVVIISLLVVLSLAATVIRCYSRVRYSRVFDSEDYLAVFAFVFAVVLAALSIWQMLHGIGLHMNDRPSESKRPPPETPFAVSFLNMNGDNTETPAVKSGKLNTKQQLLLLTGPVLSPMVHITGVTLIKLSLLVFYRRLVPSNRFRSICMSTIVFVMASWIGLMGALLFQCKPFWALWDLSKLSTAKCVKSEYIYLSIAIVSFVADAIVFILPIPVVMRSGLPKGQKIHVLCVFFLGIIILVASAVRAVLIGRTVNTMHSDITRRVVISMLAGVIELDVAVIVACLPACKLFMVRKFNIFVMPTTPQYIWTPEATACRKAEIRMRDLEDSIDIDGTAAPGTSDSQAELRPASMGVVDEDSLSIQSDENRASSVEKGK